MAWQGLSLEWGQDVPPGGALLVQSKQMSPKAVEGQDFVQQVCWSTRCARSLITGLEGL